MAFLITFAKSSKDNLTQKRNNKIAIETAIKTTSSEAFSDEVEFRADSLAILFMVTLRFYVRVNVA